MSEYANASGGWVRIAQLGSKRTNNLQRASRSFKADVPFKVREAWEERQLALFRQQAPARVANDTLLGNVPTFMAGVTVKLATRKQMEQQLRWWCAQPLKPGTTRTLGACNRHDIPAERMAEILREAFAADDERLNPTQYANTSNHYRMSLYRLYAVLDKGLLPNRVDQVPARITASPTDDGQDARIVREILRHLRSGNGAPPLQAEAILPVLAWVHITPIQFMRMDPRVHFHDVPDASVDDIVAGAVTLTVEPRHKIGKGKKLPAPITIPLNPLGVAAMRALLQQPTAWGRFSASSLNRQFKGARDRAIRALEQRGLTIPPSLRTMTMYGLKDSLLTTARLASGGMVDRRGHLAAMPGVQAMAGHRDWGMTTLYTGAAVDPLTRQVNAATSRFLLDLLATPLTPALHLAASNPRNA